MNNTQTLEQQIYPKELTLLVEDFHAKTLVLREKWKVSKANALGCGAKCSELFGTLDLSTSSLKIRQLYLFEDLNKSYATFPKSGITQNGNVFQTQLLDTHTKENDYTLLPTPTKSTANGACKNRYFGSPTYRGNIHEYIRDGEQDSQYPHPALLESLMGFPIGWTERSV